MKKLFLAAAIASVVATPAMAALDLHDTNEHLVNDKESGWVVDKAYEKELNGKISDAKKDYAAKAGKASSLKVAHDNAYAGDEKFVKVGKAAQDAKSTLDTANALVKTSKQNVVDSEKAVKNATASVATAKKNLAEAEKGTDVDAIKKAKADLQKAETGLKNSQTELAAKKDDLKTSETVQGNAKTKMDEAMSNLKVEADRLSKEKEVVAYNDAKAKADAAEKVVGGLEGEKDDLAEGTKYNKTLDKLADTDVSHAADKVLDKNGNPTSEFKMTDGEVREGVVANNKAINKVADFANENREMIGENAKGIKELYAENDKQDEAIASNKKAIGQNRADINKLFGEVDRLDDRIDGTQASLHAVTNARPFLSGEGKTAIGVGLGNSGSVSAVAIGGAHAFTDQWSASATINSTFGGDDNDFSFGVGTQYEF